MSHLYASLFYQADMTEIFSDHALLKYMIQAEVALAKAQAQVGVIPESAAAIIADVANTQGIQAIDFENLAIATGLAGNIAIPFVKQFTAAVKAVDEDASRYVHWGATSQDILDTACILQARDALDVVEFQLRHAYAASLELAEEYRAEVMIGRTWLQQALPITFGHKGARWASGFKRDLDRLEQMKSRVLTAQLGGAVGSLASLLDQGSTVVDAYAAQLNLSVPTCTWHGERDRIIEIAGFLAIVVGNTGKMARDWSLMMQTEIAEVFEPTAKGRGGSSTMPHKRNPVAAASILAAANRVPALMSSMYQSMVQEHERSLGSWHAEWLALPEIFQLCAGALQRTVEVLQGLEVNSKNMQRNIETTQGLIMAEAVMMALAPKMGRLNAHHLVEKACKQAVAEQSHLQDIISSFVEVKQYFSADELTLIFKPESYLGNIQDQIDAVLKEAKGEAK
ncbi:3-carboxy-cis,cis-muconate cycloisomerase [Acinetobacter bohemicus]|uniref:3-carboxy-cis,cis-muconate cycloisomerase n=1 Tax=Acinetobacter bohemicus TaxID=1435036 RepID=A0A1I6QGZ4_9GAMM|nr:3-carboxy-cis,cis-muconate cycloisomerase [Acinetobacter bohemicus]KAB0653881.1 3-carboxy-cis,cis-muconate cycloisomerase [Acinetobacter bohemicus]SFS51694.1 3-carboxy-cis,cis-muconate cycloisomerase [Acinetobacter bohemicus]